MKKYAMFLAALLLFSCRLPVTTFDDIEDAIYYVASSPLPAPEQVDSLKVMTWNIRYGAARIPWFEDSCGDRVHMTESEVISHLDSISAYINADIIDILLLQEVDVSSKRSAYIDQVQYLLENTDFNYAVYGSMWKSDIIPSGGLGKVDVGVAILSRWPLSEAERIQLPLREDQKFYEKYFYLRRCMVQAKLEIPGWDDLYAVDIHAASFSTDDTKQKHIIKYKNVLDDLTDLDFYFVTGGDLNAIPPEADSLDYCMEDQCMQDEYQWHTSNDPKHYHRKGSYYNNFEAQGEYPSEPNLLTIIYDQYDAGITNDKNDVSNFTYGARNDDNPDKEYFDRKLDYLFTNYDNGFVSGRTHQDAKLFSDHIPVSAILYKVVDE
ncbi:uncharacterized protein METZ01_LOCUS175726 [marine metagenome]|uniref:Endonuclease/exonuclease/phosphatase domain-containing protein n=1 Tax=marine metagenome TaxID=408172 RepID=A0A382CAL3_9ZZZZ